VYGALLPALQSLLYRPPFKLTQPVEGMEVSTRFVQIGMAVIVYGLRYMASVAMRTVRHILPLDRMLTHSLLTLVSAPAFGLPDVEFRGALIAASDRLTMPGIFEATYWNVDRVLAEAPQAPLDPGIAPKTRYAFLWDPTTLAARQEQSKLNALVSARTKDVIRRTKNFPQVATEDLGAQASDEGVDTRGAA
jgi:hypothetical protein